MSHQAQRDTRRGHHAAATSTRPRPITWVCARVSMASAGLTPHIGTAAQREAVASEVRRVLLDNYDQLRMAAEDKYAEPYPSPTAAAAEGARDKEAEQRRQELKDVRKKFNRLRTALGPKHDA